MRLMAGETVGPGRLVRLFRFHLLLHGLMACEAEVWRLREKEVLQPGLVGVVALGAIPAGYRRVGALGRIRPVDKRLMAAAAEGPLVGYLHSRQVATVRVMTGQAAPLRVRLVFNAPFDRLHHLGVAVRAELW